MQQDLLVLGGSLFMKVQVVCVIDPPILKSVKLINPSPVVS